MLQPEPRRPTWAAVAPHPHLDEAEDRRLVELCDEGLPLAEILRLTGRSSGALSNALWRRKRRPDRMWENREHRQWYGGGEASSATDAPRPTRSSRAHLRSPTSSQG